MIYISGPMSDIKHYNHPEFNRVAAALRAVGHKVFNPAEIVVDTSGMNKKEIWQAYMDICIPAVEKCNAIYLLVGWEKSPGAKRELKRAIELDFDIILQSKNIG